MKQKIINLEAGMPTVEVGQKILQMEVATAKRQKIRVLKVIHGYGSSGVGGRLKKGTQSWLLAKQKEGLVKAFIPGDDWSIFSAATREVLQEFGELRNDSDLNRGNPGITIVIL